MASGEGETREFPCSGALEVTESEGSGATGPGLKEECVPAGEVASNGDTGLLNMMRVMVSQMAELNHQFSEMRNTVRGGLAEMSTEARAYTDNSCAAIRRDMQEELDACHDRISHIYQTVQAQTLAAAASRTPPCAPSPPGTPPASSDCPAARSGPAPQLSINPGSAPRHPCSFGEVTGRQKPAEFDGTVTWEAYVAQFELMAEAQG